MEEKLIEQKILQLLRFYYCSNNKVATSVIEPLLIPAFLMQVEPTQCEKNHIYLVSMIIRHLIILIVFFLNSVKA